MYLIKIKKTYGIHEVQSQSHREENWMGEGWAVVPPEFEEKLTELYPFVILTISDGAVFAIEDDIEERKNAPNPVPEVDPITQIQLAIAELAEAGAQHDIENKLAIAELVEAMTGGK